MSEYFCSLVAETKKSDFNLKWLEEKINLIIKGFKEKKAPLRKIEIHDKEKSVMVIGRKSLKYYA